MSAEDERPRGVDQQVLPEQDRADDRPALHGRGKDRRERVRRGDAREVQVVAEVGREPDGAGEDRQREPGDDLARAHRDHEERVDRRHHRAGDRCEHDADRERDRARRMDPIDAPEADHGAHEHHPLDAEVQHPGALRQQLAERRVQERRPVGDPRGDHDDEQAVIHAAPASGVGRRSEPGERAARGCG